MVAQSPIIAFGGQVNLRDTIFSHVENVTYKLV